MSHSATRSAADAAPPDPGTPLLVAREVSVSFGGLHAVRDVDIDVGQREVVAVVGPNGAGKTTLLNALSGIVRMRGTLTFDGQVVQPINARGLTMLGICRSFQHPHLIEQEDVLENVLCGAHLRAGYNAFDQVARRFRSRRAEHAMADRAKQLLAQAQVDEQLWRRPVAQLPHGARKRIDIVRALMREPILLMMDEPTSGMGETERHIVQDLICDIRSLGDTAVLLVEHHMDVIRAVADRVVAMESGSVLTMGRPEEVLESQEFIAASVGQVLSESVDPDLITHSAVEDSNQTAPPDVANGGPTA